ncbi:hypothetical protein [Paenibacillus tianmuensis]|nr:hypothetical protein [Paenibacillus tianmuensis]
MKKFVLLMALSLAVVGTVFVVSPDENRSPGLMILYSDVDGGH